MNVVTTASKYLTALALNLLKGFLERLKIFFNKFRTSAEESLLFIIIFALSFASASTQAKHVEMHISSSWHQADKRDVKNHTHHDFSHDKLWNNINESSHHKHQFNRYTAHDFRQHFTNHGYTENQILNQRCLYMFDEFVKFAQTYSGYKCTIQQLHAELQKLNFIQKAWYSITGTYCSGLQKRIQYLYNQLSTLKNESPVRKEPIVRDLSLEKFSEQQPEYKALEPIYSAHVPSLARAIDDRRNAYNNITSADYALQYVRKSYNLNNNVKQLLHKYNHDTTRFTQCFGNQLHQTIHQESLNLLDHIDHLSPNSVLYDHQEALVDFTVAMVDYNHENCIDKATAIADLCWTLLDYGQAMAEGAALGVYSAATDILNNPIEATVCLAAGKQVLTYQLCKVLYTVADIGVTALSDIDHAKDKWNHYAEPLNNIIDKIYNKEVSVRDVIKNGTAFVVGYKAQVKLLGGLGKFCNTIKQKSINFAKNSSLLNPQEYLTTPEGLLFKATANADKLKQSGQSTASGLKNSVEKVAGTKIIPEFIQQNRIPLDRETILHSAHFKKTKISPVKGAQVYTKENLFYHRDTLHKGKGAHLEVYNKQGIHLGEADPITGQLIKNTADKNKKLNLR